VLIYLALAMADQQSGAIFGVPRFAWAGGFVVAALGVLWFSLANWRCPACEKRLGKDYNPRFCPRCGVRLKPEDQEGS